MKTFGSMLIRSQIDILDQSLVVHSKQVFDKLEHLHRNGVPLWRDILYVSMQACHDISAGRRIHSLMASSCFDSVAVLGDPLIRLFGSCQSLFDANIVFCKVEKASGFTWHSIIWAHNMLGEHGRAFELYQEMQAEPSVKPGKHTISCILKACGALRVPWKGMLVHNQVLLDELDSDVVVGSCLVDMYVKWSCLHVARNVFDRLSNPNEVVWNVMIAGYVQLGHNLPALQLFEKMRHVSIKPGKVTFLCILKVCQNKEPKGFLWGRCLHSLILRDGFESDIEVGSALVDMYARWGSLEEARVLFVGLPTKNAVVWGAMISGYAQHGYGHLAVRAFEDMQGAGLKPDQVLYSCVLKGLASKEAIEKGMLFHRQIVLSGLDVDTVLGSSLIDMYIECGDLNSAQKLFSMLPVKNLITWSSLIAGYAHYADCSSALQLFIEMQQQGIEPDRVTFVSLLQACRGTSATIHTGRLILNQIIEMGFESDAIVAGNLVRMFAECGSLEEALILFNSSSSRQADVWGDLISAYAQIGLDQLALELFQRAQEEGITVQKDVIVSILKSCGNLGALSEGKLIHERMMNKVSEMDMLLGNALLEMYTTCGAWKEARDFFDEISSRDVVSWGIMMTGYNDYGCGHHALQLFEKMRQIGLEPDTVAFSCALNACGRIGSLYQGRAVHDQFLRSGLTLDVIAENTLIDLYGKCGSLEDARRVFDLLPCRNEVSWNSMIAGYADCGMLKQAGQCLSSMQGHGVKPSAATYSSMFAGCGHAGQAEKGWAFFRSMTEKHLVAPTSEHFNCMVDILARTGFLHEAEELLHVAPILPDVPGWTSLLTACKAHSNSEVGQQCHNKIGLLIAQLNDSVAPGNVCVA